ncbi:DUF4333 domain-containing protein [Streptomyces sp. NPDC058678]|uniref:DUF4333 domain-containing protein n=1 Tax=Streptomyces sp. NPDC058678 TaxID=3346595 RepID=UPI00366113A8
MRSRILGVVVGAAAVLVPLLLFTHRISRTESTTGLDRHSAETIDGHKALRPDIVAGRTLSMYHPLPWVGTPVKDMSCPTGLKAVTGTRLTCHGTRNDGSLIDVPVTVLSVTGDSITWQFDR